MAGDQISCNDYCDDCSLCLTHPECGWAIDRNTNQSVCLERMMQTCPPTQHDWYLDQCPCSGCTLPLDDSGSWVKVGNTGYNLGWQCSFNASCGECQAFKPSCCCMTHDDCDENSYCLFSSYGASDSGSCVPWEQEGGSCGSGSCGGNTDTRYHKQCVSSCECGSSYTCQKKSQQNTPYLPPQQNQTPQQNTCQTSDDCDSTNYCLWDSNVSSDCGSCVAWEQEGGSCGSGSCGGNTDTRYHKQCDSSCECGSTYTCQKKSQQNTPYLPPQQNQTPQQNTCQTSDDCDSTYYCLWDSNGPSDCGSCVAFEQEGGSCGSGSCGGNADTRYHKQCDSSCECGSSFTCQKKNQQYTPYLPPQNTCQTSDDCDSTNYCLWDSNGSSDCGSCVPWEQEGGSCGSGSCGGNTDTRYHKQCDSSCECGSTYTCQKKSQQNTPYLPPQQNQTPQQNTCQTSDDCDNSNYCLWDTNGPSDCGSCVPWEQEGGPCGSGSCGGNTDTRYHKQCDSSCECGSTYTCQKKSQQNTPYLPPQQNQTPQQNTCQTSDDCDSTNYCLWDSNGPSDCGSCVPWEQEGGPCGSGSCGGNTDTRYHKQCDSSCECGSSFTCQKKSQQYTPYSPPKQTLPSKQNLPSKPTTCQTSNDCDDTCYCLWDTKGSSDCGSCVPWEQEGGSCGSGSCGGNTDTRYHKQCDSSCECGSSFTCQRKSHQNTPYRPTKQTGQSSITSHPQNSCQTSNDCDNSNYCLWDSNRSSDCGYCVAFEQEGGSCGSGSCGGNTDTRYHKQCDSSCECGSSFTCQKKNQQQSSNQSSNQSPKQTCKSTSDCDSTCYCSFNGHSGSGSCLPWVQEGGSCGGNQRCHPSCQCGFSGVCQKLKPNTRHFLHTE